MTQEQKKKGERIAKIIARAGICSRREAERYIAAGKVILNDEVLDTPATLVTSADKIIVDGKLVPQAEGTKLFMYHKPTGTITSNKDNQNRPTIFDDMRDDLPRLITVGRLDFNSEGLLLLTNDGELARHLELPSTGWKRKYRVRAFGAVDLEKLESLKDGIRVDGIKYGPIEAILEKEQGRNNWLEVSLKEGKNREIRKVMEAVGLQVNRLIRVSYGPFNLGNLPVSEVKEIEKRALHDQIGSFFNK